MAVRAGLGRKRSCKEISNSGAKLAQAAMEEVLRTFHHQQGRPRVVAVDPAAHLLESDQFVIVTLDHQPSSRGSRNRRQIQALHGRGDRDQLHGLGGTRSPQGHCRAKRKTRQPKGLALPALPGPRDRGQGVINLAATAVVTALTGANAAKIKAQRRHTEFLHRPGKGMNDLVLHRAAVKRMRVADDTNSLRRTLSGRIFQPNLYLTRRTFNPDRLWDGRFETLSQAITPGSLAASVTKSSL